MLQKALLELVWEGLKESFPDLENQKFTGLSRLSGGDCSEVYLVSVPGIENLCLKVLRRKGGQLRTEMRSLLALSSRFARRIAPRVYGVREKGPYQILLLEYLEKQSFNGAFSGMSGLGRLLCQLHHKTATEDLALANICDAKLAAEFRSGRYLGFYCDNFIGLTPQKNTQSNGARYTADQWPEFFAELRLLPMMELCRDKGLLQKKEVQAIEALCAGIADILPRLERASLLHGDLWAGNVFWCGSDPMLIDPACYYGHYEVDLAMTRLFSGFSAEFYESYYKAADLSAAESGASFGAFGATERFAIYNLYHLLNHLLLFGSSYYSGVWNIIKAWSTSP